MDIYNDEQEKPPLLETALTKFEKIHKRKPTMLEKKNIAEFVIKPACHTFAQRKDLPESKLSEESNQVSKEDIFCNSLSLKTPEDAFSVWMDDSSDSDYMPSTEDSEDDIDEYVDRSAEDRPLV